jgi:hypothetical protein
LGPARNFHTGYFFLLRGLSRDGIVIWPQHLSRERISRGKQHHIFFSLSENRNRETKIMPPLGRERLI